MWYCGIFEGNHKLKQPWLKRGWRRGSRSSIWVVYLEANSRVYSSRQQSRAMENPSPRASPRPLGSYWTPSLPAWEKLNTNHRFSISLNTFLVPVSNTPPYKQALFDHVDTGRVTSLTTWLTYGWQDGTRQQEDHTIENANISRHL